MDRLCPPCAVFIIKHGSFEPELVCVCSYTWCKPLVFSVWQKRPAKIFNQFQTLTIAGHGRKYWVCTVFGCTKQANFAIIYFNSLLSYLYEKHRLETLL